MNEQQWLSTSDVDGMIEFIRDRSSLRKQRLVSVAVYRNGAIGPHCFSEAMCTAANWNESRSDYAQWIDVAERVADGLLSWPEFRSRQSPEDESLAEEIGLVPQNHSDFGRGWSWADGFHLACITRLRDQCFHEAADAARDAAWTCWRTEVKSHLEFRDERQLILESVTRLYGHEYVEAWERVFDDPKLDKRQFDFGELWRDTRTIHAPELDKTRSENWNATWERTFHCKWKEVWDNGSGRPWEPVFDDPEGKYITYVRDEHWYNGPWCGFSGGWSPDLDWDRLDDLERVRWATVFREVFGNPFRLVTVDPAWLTWNEGVVSRLAETIYTERKMPQGTLESDQLCGLADTLEDAGCVEARILTHLRDPGPHFRGCWALDLLLGKA